MPKLSCVTSSTLRWEKPFSIVSCVPTRTQSLKSFGHNYVTAGLLATKICWTSASCMGSITLIMLHIGKFIRLQLAPVTHYLCYYCTVSCSIGCSFRFSKQNSTTLPISTITSTSAVTVIKFFRMAVHQKSLIIPPSSTLRTSRYEAKLTIHP